jgi:predicted DNA binding CopG/RHH family protein
MASKNQPYKVPKFNNLEEEDKFWQEHSPLLEGHEGEIQKENKNRDSFLSIRLSGQELANLREKAKKYGLAPSTYARQLIFQGVLEEPLPPEVPYLIFSFFPGGKREEYRKKIEETYGDYLKEKRKFANKIAILCQAIQEDIVQSSLEETLPKGSKY